MFIIQKRKYFFTTIKTRNWIREMLNLYNVKKIQWRGHIFVNTMDGYKNKMYSVL